MQTQTHTQYDLRLTPSTGTLHYSDPYIDIIWTPIVGPCATALLRTLVHVAQRHPTDPHTGDERLSALVGVSPSRIRKALVRLRQHHLITQTGNTITIPNAVAHAPNHRIQTLPKSAAKYAQNRHATTTRQQANQ